MSRPASILIRPLVTEKSTTLKDVQHQYSFVVAKDAAKGDIASAVEALFGVRVLKVRTSVYAGKMRRLGRTAGRLGDWKKAIVTIPSDQKIDFEKV